MTDPRIAALAAALHALSIGCRVDYRGDRDCDGRGHEHGAAAILAALPDDWCGHVAGESAEKWVGLMAEIARLRAIEEAARKAEERLETLWSTPASPQEDPERWAQSVYFTLDALRAALGSER